MFTSQPRILVTNDDGVRAESLHLLALAAAALGEVYVVVPAEEHSGASHALSLGRSVHVYSIEARCFAVEGTPVDCVNLAFFALCGSAPDLVLSGINAGYNLAEDVSTSGTVAAAMEGRILGARALAVSVHREASRDEIEEAARVACSIGARLLDAPGPCDVFLNLNVPPRPKGQRVTRQGWRAARAELITCKEPGREYVWDGLGPGSWRDDPEADHRAIQEGYVSITPLRIDQTAELAPATLRAWGLETVQRRTL